MDPAIFMMGPTSMEWKTAPAKIIAVQFEEKHQNVTLLNQEQSPMELIFERCLVHEHQFLVHF